MPAPDPSVQEPSLARRLLAVDSLGPTSDATRPLARATVLAIVTPFVAWLGLMGAIALAAGAGLEAVAAGGWRIAAYRDLSAAAFGLALVTSVGAAIALEARRPRGPGPR